MKKNRNRLRWDGIHRPWVKILIAMKLTVILSFLILSQAFALKTYSQRTLLSLKMENVTIKDVLRVIEDKSEYYFLYNDDLINVNRRVSIEVKDQKIHDILSQLFADRSVNFLIKDRQIVLSPLQVEETNPMVSLQQTKGIKGKVTDISGAAMPGVSVVVKGTTTGSITDMDGNYSINSIPEGATLVFSFVGMKPQEIKPGSQTVLNVTLQEDAIGIEEVVAIGYGTRAKKDLTGAVSQINSEEMTKQVNMSPELAMQGKMAGVFVSNPGSSPTARPTIRIRGVSTLGYNDPLYVVDGIPLTEGGASNSSARTQDQRGDVNVFNMINPNDIESISVLKDASATAIYGVRASNGVILITTKRGSEGKAKVDVSASYGIQNINKRYDVATPEEYVDWSLEAVNANKAYVKDQYYPFYDKASANFLGTSANYSKDWMDAALVKNAPVQDYNISVSGGNKVSNFATGAGYAQQDNVIYKDGFDRFSFFLNSDHKVGNWLKLGESYRFSYSRFDNRTDADFSDASFVVPWQPFYDPNGPGGFAPTGRTVDGKFIPYGYGLGTRSNFMGIDQFVKHKRDLLRNMGTFYAEVSPLKGLRFRGTFSFDYYTNKREVYEEPSRGLFSNSRGTPYTGEGNIYGQRNNENINIIKEFLIGYNGKLGNHSVDVVLNAMDQSVKWNNTQMSVSKNSPITSWDQRYINEGWDVLNKGLLYERTPSGLQGYMGRLSYNFNSKYYFDATVRRDGTSKFGPGYKWGTFPSFALAWRMSSEKFMEGIEWLDDLKLRGGWGQTGNQETRDYAFLSLVNVNPKVGFGTGATGSTVGDGTIYPAAALGDLPIEDMSWETVTTSSLGFDAVLLDNKMTFTAEYYDRLTDGILQTISVPQVVGVLNSPVVNLAKVENSGFEFQVGYADKVGKIGYNASLNLTTVKNEVKTLYRGQPSTNGNSRIEEGYSMNFIYGYKTDGIFQTEQEVTDWKAANNDVGYAAQKSPGDIRFVDLYGAPTAEDPAGALKHYAPDGKIDANDMTYLGKTIPGYYYGINGGLDYQNWDVSFSFRGVGDVQRINTNGLQSISGMGLNYLAAYRDRWTTTNPSNTIPRAIQADPSGNNRIADRHVQNAGFLRFQNFQIGYNFQGAVLNKIGANKLRCYVSGSNLFVISPYDDLDPENITTPVTFSVGATLSF